MYLFLKVESQPRISFSSDHSSLLPFSIQLVISLVLCLLLFLKNFASLCDFRARANKTLVATVKKV